MYNHFLVVSHFHKWPQQNKNFMTTIFTQKYQLQMPLIAASRAAWAFTRSLGPQTTKYILYKKSGKLTVQTRIQGPAWVMAQSGSAPAYMTQRIYMSCDGLLTISEQLYINTCNQG